jgi:hypothetical protein
MLANHSLRNSAADMCNTVSPPPCNPPAILVATVHKLRLCSQGTQEWGIDENGDTLMSVGRLHEECDSCLFSWKFQNKPEAVFSQHLSPYLPQHRYYLSWKHAVLKCGLHNNAVCLTVPLPSGEKHISVMWVAGGQARSLSRGFANPLPGTAPRSPRQDPLVTQTSDVPGLYAGDSGF